LVNPRHPPPATIAGRQAGRVQATVAAAQRGAWLCHATRPPSLCLSRQRRLWPRAPRPHSVSLRGGAWVASLAGYLAECRVGERGSAPPGASSPNCRVRAAPLGPREQAGVRQPRAACCRQSVPACYTQARRTAAHREACEPTCSRDEREATQDNTDAHARPHCGAAQEALWTASGRWRCVVRRASSLSLGASQLAPGGRRALADFACTAALKRKRLPQRCCVAGVQRPRWRRACCVLCGRGAAGLFGRLRAQQGPCTPSRTWLPSDGLPTRLVPMLPRETFARLAAEPRLPHARLTPRVANETLK